MWGMLKRSLFFIKASPALTPKRSNPRPEPLLQAWFHYERLLDAKEGEHSGTSILDAQVSPCSPVTHEAVSLTSPLFW